MYSYHAFPLRRRLQFIDNRVRVFVVCEAIDFQVAKRSAKYPDFSKFIVLLDREDEQRVSGASTNTRHLTRFSYDTLLRCKREDCRTWLDARWTVHIYVVIAQERFTYPTEIVKPPNRTLV